MSDKEIDTSETENESSSSQELILASDALPESLIIVPLQQRPIFPGMVIPLIITGAHAIKAIEAVENSPSKLLGFILTRNDVDESEVVPDDLYSVGVVANIIRLIHTDEDSLQIMISALERFTVVNFVANRPFLMAQVKYHVEPDLRVNKSLKAYSLAIISSIKELISLNPLFKEEIKLFLGKSSLDDPGKLADFAVSLTTANKSVIQKVLETFNVKKRIDRVLIILKKELDLTRLQAKITKQIEDKISQRQREFFLKEQLKEIKKELGLSKDDRTSEIDQFTKRLKKLKLSEEAKEVVDTEMSKLQLLEPSSPEFGVVRGYLDWLTSLPWGVFSRDNYNVAKASRILEKDHYGLEDIKERILEFISVGKLKGDISGSILCFVGPPGVGKTSLGKSVARALGRKFFRFSLGGMKDEAEIKGHRRTYIGAMPGKIIQSLKTVKTANPVIMLDEIDKVGNSFQGDPASALLEVLDPEQNLQFLDHFLDVRFDLSNIMFIATANQTDTIPAALLDRMEIINLSGYILEEKLEIAKRYLIPKQLKNHGLTSKQLKISSSVIRRIIDSFARESGVRGLENQIKKICRKAARKLAVDQEAAPVKVQPRDLKEFLGNPIFSEDQTLKLNIPGVVMGLAWTSYGGTTLFIESIRVKDDKAGFKQTGQLGGVMVESSDIAYSFVRSSIEKYGGKPEFLQKSMIHLHVPAGATPKDGPSAGITMATSLISLATGRAVKRKIAMTGELTLTGKVLPIGGLKEKTIAAIRAKTSELIFPEENRKDYDDLPDHIKKGLQVNFVNHYDEVFKIIFG
ncbi:MAG: endopeptidase La [bacterium]